MNVFVLLLLGLQAFLTRAASTNNSVNELSTSLDKQCGPYCYSLMKPLIQREDEARKVVEESTITIINNDKQIKELEARVAELQANLEVFKQKESEHERKIKSDDDLVAEIISQMDILENKVQQIAQVNSGKILK